MPIRWSALKVSETADEIEKYFNQAAKPMEQMRVVLQEARRIPNLPLYIDQYFARLLSEISRAIGGSQWEPVGRYRATLDVLRKALPEGSVKAEQDSAKRGITQALF